MAFSWSGIGDFLTETASGLGGFARELLETDLGQQFAGYGVQRLAQKIGMAPKGSMAGSPSGVVQYRPYMPPSYQLPRPPGSVNPAFAPQGWTPLAAVPATQPYGVIPGSEYAPTTRGDAMPSFPVTRNMGFPAQQASWPAALGALGRQIPGMLAGVGISELMEAPAGAVSPGGGTPMFRPTMAGYRPQTFRAQNPQTGQDVYFRPAGRPILWSSDLSACKRVKKIAARARRKR